MLKRGVRWTWLTDRTRNPTQVEMRVLWSVLLRRDTVGDELGAGAYVQAFHH